MLTSKDLKKLINENSGIILYHGGLSDSINLDEIDCDKLGQQNKKGRTYGGFYLTDEVSRTWSEQFAMTRNGNIHSFLIKSSAKILFGGNRVIDRLSEEERKEYAKQYDLIQGKDILGRTQYFLLNKTVVIQIGYLMK